MALLTLKDIGKIYVSDGNVAVGIRGVNLSFDRGEFVAVTGKSGSGKSTLLNVISGMDSYEEGEMLVEGKPTSHYLQPEWEEYRKKYISFIFQDYNIIESFTVLQNVELALMHIEDKKERRRRAKELLDRVGLSSHLNHKGSKLSGGQKQRTVIARALAKDSPIILADEPTGNLDSNTSKEIIELLREVSRDKLLIVVTHNFEQVEEYATRHIRVFDGAVESDHALRDRETVFVETVDEGEVKTETSKPKKNKKTDFRNGLVLGRTVFTSKPKLSLFLCLLMIVGALGIFFMTSLCGDAMNMFDKHYMFAHIDGRVVITDDDGSAITEDDVKQMTDEYGAEDYLRYDILLDKEMRLYLPTTQRYYEFSLTYLEGDTDGLIGSLPDADNEVMLKLPLSFKTKFGDDPEGFGSVYLENMTLDVVGICYYADNNVKQSCVFSEDGFMAATAVYYLCYNGSSPNIQIDAYSDNGAYQNWNYYNVVPSYDVEEGKIYIYDTSYKKAVSSSGSDATVRFNASYYNYNYSYMGIGDRIDFSTVLGADAIAENGPALDMGGPINHYPENATVAVHPSLLVDIVEATLDKSYRQTSLFFENDRAAADAVERLRDDGYIAVLSDTTYTPDSSQLMSEMLMPLMLAVLWVLAILFLAFFINLCSSRTVGAFKGDMAIMRSMGIPVKVIRVAMYVRMLIALIPAYIVVILTSLLVFTVPAINGIFNYLYAWQYVAIFLGLLLLTVRITHKQIRKLFGLSVRRSLRGGAAND